MAGSSGKRKRSDENSAVTTTANAPFSHTYTSMPLRSRRSAAAQTIPDAKNESSQAQESVTEPVSSNRVKPAATEQDSSDDEAPEAISTSVSKAQLRAREEAQSRAIKDAESRTKSQRKERQQRLDEQAKERSVKRRRLQQEQELLKQQQQQQESEVSDDEGEEAEDLDAEDIANRNLLPASLLAQLSDVRPPTPPPDDTAATRQRKAQLALSRKRQAQKLLLKNKIITLPSAGAPRDLSIGHTSVRVLAGKRGSERVLPPARARSKANSAMGNWMRGRQAIGAASTAKGRGAVRPRSGRVQRKPFGSSAAFN